VPFDQPVETKIMKVNPCVNFRGQCAEAFRYYVQHLGGRIQMMMTFAESPMKDQTAADWQDKVIHGTLALGDGELNGMDAGPSRYAEPKGTFVSLTVAAADAERIFKALADGGNVTMPFQKTFWSPGFGMVTDRFGVPWMVGSEPAA
jgi:PhnB protein